MSFFRIVREGPTIDGREVTRQQIQEMADSYDQREQYAARIWLEHIRAYHPDSTFKAYGDVLELRAEEENGELYLTAKLDPTKELIQFNKAGQKLYSSVEIDPNYRGTGKAYLVGLAVTDSPASTGTSRLEFSKKNTHKLISECLELEGFSQTFKGDDNEQANTGAVDTNSAENNHSVSSVVDYESEENPYKRRYTSFFAASKAVDEAHEKQVAALQAQIDQEKATTEQYKAQLEAAQTELDTFKQQSPDPNHKPRPKAEGESFSNEKKEIRF